METVDRMHHICLTVSSENWREVWPLEMEFFTEFLRMNAYYIAVEEFDFEIAKAGMEEGMGLGPQEIDSWYDDGTPRLDYFFYVAGEDMSETASMIDLIVFVTKPGQLTQPHPNLHTLGLRSMTMLVDNIDAIYQRGLDAGYEFLSAPVSANWDAFGEVKYCVVKDIVGNAIELVQTQDVEPGEGKVKRIFSNNQNTQDIEKALAFYRDGCGMTVEAVVEQSGADFAKSVGVQGDAKATTYFLKGTNPKPDTTMFSLTTWENPVVTPITLPEKQTQSYYRQWFWVNGDSSNVKNLYDKMSPKMKFAAQEPFTYPSCRPWSECTMSFFLDDDDVLQEFANHKAGEGEWKGLGEMIGNAEFEPNFERKQEWLEQAEALRAKKS